MEQKEVKKKILIFVPEFPALTQTFIERDISRLVEFRRLEVVVIYLKKGLGKLSENLEFCTFAANLNIFHILRGLSYLWLKPARVKYAYSLLMRDLTKHVGQRLYLFLKSLGYAKIISTYKPDEIHAHFLSDPSSIAMVASVLLEIPFSINAHARDVLEYPTLPQSKGELAKFICVCNKNAYDRCLEITEADHNKVHLVHHGLDPERLFANAKKIPKFERPMIFMGGTRLTEKKGLEYMILASKLLKDRGISHRVDVIGPGVLYESLQKMVEDNDLRETFFIHGEGKGASFEEIAGYYLVADLFVLPLTTTNDGDADGIPNALIEAALARLPIVTTDAGSVPELIEDGVTGVLVRQRDVGNLATEVEKLLFDDKKKAQLGQAVYERAVVMFDTEKNISLLENLLLQ